MKTMIIGICGGSGSGKTTLSKKLLESLGDKATIVYMDNFYKFQPNTTYEERCLTNYDHPDAFDADILIQCVKELKEGKNTKIPVYDFTIHNRSEEEWQTVEAKPIIILDGILLFAIPELLEFFDLKIFVDTPADIRILRRLRRDVRDRARSIDSVIEQYTTTVKPMHDKFIEPTKKYADIIVPEGGKNEKAYNLIINALVHQME